MTTFKNGSRCVPLAPWSLIGLGLALTFPVLATAQEPQQDPEQQYWTREYTVPVSLSRNTRTVDLRTRVGDLRVVPGDGSELRIVVKALREFVGEDELSGSAEDHFRLQQDGGRLVIESLHQEEEEEGPTRWAVSFSLSTPRALGVTADTSVGDIEAVDVAGDASLHTSVGDVSLDSDEVGSLSAVVGVGDIDLRCGSITGSFEVKTGTGSLDLVLGSVAQDAEATTGVGDVHLGYSRGFSAQLELSTGIGSIDAPGADLGSDRGLGQQASIEVGQGGRRLAVSTGVGQIAVRSGNGQRRIR